MQKTEIGSVARPFHVVEIEFKALHRHPGKTVHTIGEGLLTTLGQQKNIRLLINQACLDVLVDLVLLGDVRGAAGGTTMARDSGDAPRRCSRAQYSPQTIAVGRM